MYNTDNAKEYWKNRIVDGNGELNTVLSYSENPIINKYYDAWEKQVIMELFGDLTNQKILDLPGGIGRWTKVFSEKGGNVTCVDVCEEIIELIKMKLGNDSYDNVTYIVSDVNSMNFEDASFDKILCTGLFEHLPQSVYLNTTEKFSKMLAKNGKIIIVINNKRSNFIKQLEDNPFRLGEQLENGYFCGISDYDRIISKLEENGIKISNLAINPSYSVIRQIYKDAYLEEKQLDKLFENAVKKDVQLFSNLNNFDSSISDQIIILGEKI